MQNSNQPLPQPRNTKRLVKYILLTPIVLFVAYLLGYYFVYTPIAKFFDKQNFVAAERDIEAIYNSIPADEKLIGDVQLVKSCEDMSSGFENEKPYCEIKITSKYPVSTPEYANEIADKYLTIMRASDRLRSLQETDSRKSMHRREFLRGGYSYMFSIANSSMYCTLAYYYNTTPPTSGLDGEAINNNVYLYPSITCGDFSLDYWFNRANGL